METLSVKTGRRTCLHDLTAKINDSLAERPDSTKAVIVFTRHTTTGLTINENEPGLLQDMEKKLQELVGPGKYEHDRIDSNADSHLRSMLLEHSLVIPVVGNRLGLGTWQRVFLAELDGPRARKVDLIFL
jgi:secondary thiamine-phosphate synthase enzyme